MSVNADQNIGSAVVDRETGQGFTPGPWVLDYSRDSSRIKDAEGTTLAVAYDLRRDADGKEEYANARLIAAAPSLATFLMKIYLDYEADCGCECDSETCCAVVGEKCAKCHANVALLMLDQGANESAKRPISDRGNPGQAS